MNQKVFAPIVIILIVIGLLVVGGGVYFYQQQKKVKISQEELPQQKTEIPTATTTTTETEKQVENLQFGFPKGGEILNIGKEYKVLFTPFSLNLKEKETTRWWLENETRGFSIGLQEGYITTDSGKILQGEITDSDYEKGISTLKIDDINIGDSSYGDEYRLILKKVKILEVGCDPTGCPEDIKSLGESGIFRFTYSQPSDRVSDFTAKVFGNKVFLSWSFVPPGEDVIIGHGTEITYSSAANIYRETSPNFIPDQSNLITIINKGIFDYTDKNLSSGIYYYKLVAKDWNMGTVPFAEVQAIVK